MEVRFHRLRWTEVVLYDGRVVSRHRFRAGGTHAFWVGELGKGYRFEVDTKNRWRIRIVRVRKNGVTQVIDNI